MLTTTHMGYVWHMIMALFFWRSSCIYSRMAVNQQAHMTASVSSDARGLKDHKIPAPPNYPLRYPKYHLIETIRPLVVEVHGGGVGTKHGLWKHPGSQSQNVASWAQRPGCWAFLSSSVCVACHVGLDGRSHMCRQNRVQHERPSTFCHPYTFEYFHSITRFSNMQHI